ncbi:16S rRNA methyltransferase B [Paucilactobacillus oligofermentans DSM 15707 = LMG 22743]|uniref:16S rRNA (cytosine(967)-C(5))-methyltransferase n=1 Tax=Paucilactobacillus oligofermentans DSM 15707 = LMG 22743 TaxID=1423778 RepID=A0A0R1REW2_9LACO|nr:16S rRNA (cytosine(967)-C(5))-methyltransferase RsmB [Paucilactobacillus oligofermentans]KRL54910.1 16S rRNA methyltransferase B [Paucilactobacillus oligofermentans DSM 15707 = LMG 22743]CUS26175.1 Putative ribosomal RNA small subunit methyltransferase [Paucilactobacillus oligofermentans DSM 15707 = LMG 22743]
MTNSANNPKSARLLALESLEKVLTSGAYSNLQLNQVIEQNNLADNDRRLLTNLVYGVIQHRLTLEFWLESFIKGKKIDDWVKILLMMALYQYHYLDKVPEWAITDESIKLAKIKGHEGIRKFVTAILHRMLREDLRSFNKIDSEITRISIEYSVPEWLIEELSHQYGDHQMMRIVESLNHPANQSLRINTKLADKEEITRQLFEDDLEFRDSRVAANALVLERGVIANTHAFKNGEITIQDESAMLAVENMHLEKSFKVLDACAAPGGKTVQIAAMLDAAAGGKVTALDIHQNKIKLIKNNAKRLGVEDVVEAIDLDARKVDNQFDDESFDAILVDAPCSGFGLIRRKPEIRYEKELSDSYNLQKVQLEILEAVAPKIKKNGIITYSTCTILKQENDDVINMFLANHSEFILERTHTSLDLKAKRESKTLTILPSDFDSDGFFVSSLRRTM